MQLPLPRQMAVSTAASDHQYDLCQGFSMQRQWVRVEVGADANRSPSSFYRPSNDCTCDRPIRRSPKCEHPHDFWERRDQSMLQEQCSTRNGHRHGQRSHGSKAERHVDMGYGQIYSNESRMGDLARLRRNAQPHLIAQSSLRGGSGQESGRDAL